jgi:DNA-binding transcriptional LysR family regulator
MFIIVFIDGWNMAAPKTSLDQWRCFQAVVDAGGFSQAARVLHRSQSSISYAVNRLQSQLGVRLLQVQGRKAQLTKAGEVLLQRSRQLLGDAVRLEDLATHLEQGWEAEVRLVVDAAFPAHVLMQALKAFEPVSRGTRVMMHEEVLSGVDDALLDRSADLAVCGHVPKGFLGEELLRVEFVAVAHPEHRLHALGEAFSEREMAKELQVVVRDSGVRGRDVGWLGSSQRWVVSSIDTAVEAVASGLGFAWLPCHQIHSHIAAGSLKALPLSHGGRRNVGLELVFAEPDLAGPATRLLADILMQASRAGMSAEC